MQFQINSKFAYHKFIQNYFIIACFFCGIGSIITKNFDLLVILTLTLSILLVVRVRKNILLLIVFCIIAYCNYSILMLMFINPLKNSMFTKQNYTEVGFISLQILFLFMLILYLYIPKKINYINRDKLYYSKKINFILHIFNVLLILFITFALRTKDTTSTIWGYVVLLLLLGLYFSNNDKKVKLLYLIVGIIFCMQSLLTYGRLYLTQALIILFIYFFPKKLEKKLWILFPLLGILYILFNFISIYRVNESLPFVELINLTWKQIYKYLFSADTALSAFYTGQTFVMQSFTDGILQRLYMFVLLIISMFTGSSILPQSLLSEYTHKTYLHYYGGVYPCYGWYYLGGIGVILFALMLILIIRKLLNKTKFKFEFFVPVVILISASPFLWYLYHPSSMIRSPMLLILGYYGVIFADWCLKKIKNKLQNI